MSLIIDHKTEIKPRNIDILNQEEQSRNLSVSIGHSATLAPRAELGRQISNHATSEPKFRTVWYIVSHLGVEWHNV